MDQENTKQEFRSAEELHRFEASMMLGQTAVYLVGSGTLVNAFHGRDVSDFTRIGIGLFGIVLSLVFFLITRRCGLNLRGARRRAEELGSELGFKLYSPEYRAPRNRLFVGRNMTTGICLAGGFYWLVVLLNLVLG